MSARAASVALALGLGLSLAACTTVAPASAPAPPPVVTTPPPSPPAAGLSPRFLPHWDQEDHRAALLAYASGCRVVRNAASQAVCDQARTLAASSPSPSAAREFFEGRFTVVEARTATGDPGLLTAYFAPEYPARRLPDGAYDTPVLARPDDLVRGEGDRPSFVQRSPDGSTVPYPDRAAIEAGPPPGPVLAWMKAEDLFFMQIQGSGYLTFEDGGRGRAAYAADNGRPFTGIARPMAERGLLPPNGTSGDAIRAWLAAHRGPEARAITDLNPRYIFFDLQPDDGGHPAGAAGVPLTARRSIAVDPAGWTYGDLVWIEADGGDLTGARAGYRGLVTALDTGSAIRGPVRADFYMGRGDAAGGEAGTVRHPLRMWRLVPR